MKNLFKETLKFVTLRTRFNNSQLNYEVNKQAEKKKSDKLEKIKEDENYER